MNGRGRPSKTFLPLPHPPLPCQMHTSHKYAHEATQPQAHLAIPYSSQESRMVTVLRNSNIHHTPSLKRRFSTGPGTRWVSPGGSRHRCPCPSGAPSSGCQPRLPLSWQEARHPAQAPAQHPPAQVLLQHLVNADPEGLVVEALPDVVLVDAELRGGHRFAFRDLGQVKPELPVVVAWVEKLFVVFHWKGKNTHRHPKLISNWVALSSLRVEASGLS